MLTNDAVPADQQRALAKAAVIRALEILRQHDDAERRAQALIQLGVVATRGHQEGRSEDRWAAEASFDAAERIVSGLEDTAQRRELIGRIQVMRVGLDVVEAPGRPVSRPAPTIEMPYTRPGP